MPAGVHGVAVDLGGVPAPSEEPQRHAQCPVVFVGNRSEVPDVALPSDGDRVVAHHAVEEPGLVPARRHVLQIRESRVGAVVLRGVGQHLRGAEEHRVQRELGGRRRLHAGAEPGRIPGHVEHARGVVGRPAHEPGEREDGRLLRWIPLWPHVVVLLHPGDPFAGHHVGVGACQAGRLDGLVRVDHDFVAGRGVDDPLVVAHGFLVVVAAVHPAQHELGGVAGLDRVNAEFGVARKNGVEVLFVIVHEAAGLVVCDEPDAVGPCVAQHLGQVEIRLGGEEVLAGPLAAGVGVPPLGEHVARARLPGEVDVLLDTLGRRPVPRPRRPGRVPPLQLPPHTDVRAG